MKLLTGKTAIITGASRGIGRGIAKIFVAQGCNVAFTYSSNKEAADALETDLQLQKLKLKDTKVMQLILSKLKNWLKMYLLILDV